MGMIFLNGKEYTSSPKDGFPPIIYSDEEREVGVWRDGKPLYQKVFTFNQRTIIPAGAWTDTGFSANDISVVVFVSGHDIQSNEGTVWHFLGADVTGTNIRLYQNRDGSKEIGLTHFVMMYTKTTDVAGSGKYTTYGGIAHHYSTSEQVIGTWIDGKPLYQKTVNFGTLPNATSKSVNHNISSVNYIVSASGIAYNENNSYFPIPFVNDQGNNSQLLLMLSKTEITIRTSVNRSEYTKCYITIQYTKTTD